MNNGHTLQTRNGNVDPLAQDHIVGTTLKTSDANADGPAVTPTRRNKEPQIEFTFGEGVLLTPVGQTRTQDNARRERVRDDDDVSTDSLFDEEVPKVSTTPTSNPLPLPATIIGGRPQSKADATPERIGQVVTSSAKSSLLDGQGTKSAALCGEVVSVYSEDAEGEEDDDEMEVHELPRIPSPTQLQSRQKSTSSGSSPLPPTRSLFTPPPEPSKRRRLVAYVDVPPFPEGKARTDYQRPIYPRQNRLASSGSKASASKRKAPKHVPSQASIIKSAVPKPTVAKPATKEYSNLADAYNHANEANCGSLQQNPSPQQRVKKRRKQFKDPERRIIPSDPIYIVTSSPDDESDAHLSQGTKKRKKTAQYNSPVAPRHSRPRSALTDIAPLEPPRPLSWVCDSARDIIGLLEVPFDGSTNYDVWMNAKSLLPSSAVALDEHALRLASNLVPAPYPMNECWSREARRQSQGGSDGEYSLGGHWSDDEELNTDSESADEELGLESEESFGRPATPSKQPMEGPTTGLVTTEIRVTSKGTPTFISPQTNGREIPSSSLQTPRIVLSPSDLVNDTPMVPSQKALGKRRADFPPSPASRGPPARSPNRMRVGSDATVYRHMASPGQPNIHMVSHPRTIYRGGQAGDVMLSSLTMNSPRVSFGNEPQLSPMRQADEASEGDSLFFGDATTSLESSSRTMDSLRHPTGGTDSLPEQQYCLDTIDPSLLQQAVEFMPDDALFMTGQGGGEWELSYLNGEQEVRPDEPASTKWSSSSSSRGSSRSPAPSPSQKKKSAPTSKVTFDIQHPTIRRERTSPPPSETDYFPVLPPYKSDSDDADWEGSDAGRGGGVGVKLGRGKRKKTKKMRADFDWHDGSDASDGLSDSAVRFAAEEKRQAATTKKVGPPKNATKLAIGPPRGVVQWETCDVREYCHQCRNKTALLKMVCLACALKYCNRCIGGRYPDIEFAHKFPVVHPCPKCTDICNCTACCKVRGETYVSTAKGRKPKKPGSTQVEPPIPELPKKRTPKLVVRASSSRAAPPVIRTSIVVPSNDDATFMGPFYALDGSKMQVRVDAPPEVQEEAPEAPIIEPFKPKRIFIGRVPRSWGFGTQPRITDLEPRGEDELSDAGIRAQRQRRGGAAPRRKLTVYIGKKPKPPMPRPVFVVAQPVEDESEEEGQEEQEGMPRLDGLDDAFSSPLTSLPDTETEGSGDVDGDDGKSYSPESLEDNDLARAIEFTLNKAFSCTSTEPISPAIA